MRKKPRPYERKNKATVDLNGTLMSPLKFSRIMAFKDRLPELDDRLRLGAEDIGPRLGKSAGCIRDWCRILGHRLHNHNGRTVFRYDTSAWETIVLPVYRRTGSVRATAAACSQLKVSYCTINRWLINSGYRKTAWEKDAGSCRNNSTK
jgi:hypothetical protein